MNFDQDVSDDDELWAQSQEDDSTESVETEQGAEVEGAPETEATPNAEDTQTDEFDITPFLPRIAEHFERDILPKYRDQWLQEAMSRTKQSAAAREERLKQQLAPVLNLLKQQQDAGFVTPEDAQAQYNAVRSQMAASLEQQEQAQAQAELRQRWLAGQQQTQADTRPAWATSWEQHFNQVLAQSGLQEGDPELERIPLTLTDPDPKNALALFKESVATAVAEKERRLGTNGRTPKPKPFVDMGMGGGAGGVNPLAGKEDIDELWKLSGL